MSKATADLMDSIREIRRFEKNWFLYKNKNDLDSVKVNITQLSLLLESHGRDYAEVSSSKLINQFKNELIEYERLVLQIDVKSFNEQSKLQKKIRDTGHKLMELGYTFQHEEQENLKEKIHIMTINGMISGSLAFLLIFILGRKLIKSVVIPLEDIVSYSRSISLDKYDDGWKQSNIIEIKSVINSLNIMVKKIKEREQQIVQQTKMATLGTLVAGIAHELNNPLSNISTSVEILNEEIRDYDNANSEISSRMMDRIIDQTDRAKRIVKSLLEFSREKELYLENVSVSEMIADVKSLVQGKLDPGIDLIVEVKKDGYFHADRQRIQQVLINFILNAIQAVEEDGKIIVTGDYNERYKQVFLEVSDNGVGIPAENLSRIFDPFFTTKDIGEGSGLGLAVSREIVKKHGGSINVRSAPGKGASFIIILPGE